MNGTRKRAMQVELVKTYAHFYHLWSLRISILRHYSFGSYRPKLVNYR